MDVVKMFGSILSEKTGIKPMICYGMIRLALKDMGQEPEMYRFNDIKLLIDKHLNGRLEKAGIKKGEEIIRILHHELVKNQSLLLMSV